MARKIKDAIVNYSLLTDWYSWTGKKYTGKDSLYAWYQFETDVSSSGNLADLSGNSRDLSPEVDPTDRIEAPNTDSPRIYTSPTGFPTHSAAFDNDQIEFVDSSGTDDFSFGSPSSNDDSPFSVEVWVKTTYSTPSTIDQYILGKYLRTGDYREWVVYINNGKPSLYLSSEGGPFTDNFIRIEADQTLDSDRWYHIVATYDGTASSSGMSLYIDGKRVTTTTQSDGTYDGMTGSTTARFTIGNSDDESNSLDFVGKLAQVALWSKELSSGEVGALYEAKQATAEFKSGISSIPARLQLRERDQDGTQYPLNSRVGDFDAQRSRSSLPFNDTNTISFLSNFASAKLHINGRPFYGTSIDITGSNGDVSRRFKYIYTLTDPKTTTSPDDILMPLGSPITTTTKEDIQIASSLLVSSINKEKSLGVEIFYKPTVLEKLDSDGNPLKERVLRNTLVLRHKTPGTGSFIDGNLLNIRKFKFLTDETTPDVKQVVAEQFKISTQAPMTLGTLTPLDGDSLSTIISIGHTSPSLISSGSLIPGVSDNFYKPKTNYSITPFSEHKVKPFSDDPFDTSGTESTVLEGFSSPIYSKTILNISCKSENTSGDSIFYASGASGHAPLGTYTPGIAGKIGSGFAYWSPGSRQWEMKGVDLSHEEISPFAANNISRQRSALGFTLIPSTSINTSNLEIEFSPSNSSQNRNVVNALRVAGLPTNTYGFPNSSQYNATGSQEILMSNHISHPFLLEKIKVQIKGVFGVGTGSLNQIDRLPINKTFFILNQKTNGDKPHVTGTLSSTISRVANSDNSQLETQISRIPARGDREVVSWGKIGFLNESSYIFKSDSSVIDKLYEDYDAVSKFNSGDISPSLTGTINLNLEPRLAFESDFLSPSTYKNDQGVINTAIQANNHGGADLRGNVSGRQIASSLGGSKTIGTGSFTYFNEPLEEKESYYAKSPYLLLPKDRLVLGWQNIATLSEESVTGSNYGFTSQAQGDLLVDKIQEVNISLFGSLIRDNREFHDTLNQNLSSNQVHEAIFGSHDVDQFEVEPLHVLSGSTFDSLFFGDMILDNSGVRGRRASIAKGEAGSTGSLQRNIGIAGSGKYADSLTPHIEFLLSDPEYFKESDAAESGVNSSVLVGTNIYQAIVLSNNPISSSFKLLKALGMHQTKNIRGNRSFKEAVKQSPASNYLATPGGGLASTADFLSFDVSSTGDAVYKIYSGTVEFQKGVSSFGSPEISTEPSRVPTSILGTKAEKIAISSIFYASPVVSTFGKITWPILQQGLSLIPFLRGARYGFSNPSPIQPKNYFRRSTYGQFRDLMEQAPETAVVGLVNSNNAKIDLEAAEGPVRVRFFSRNGTEDIDPLDTNSQNLSQFATSSLPYFDGLNKERDVITFPPPDDVDKIGVEEATLALVDGDA